MREQVRLKTLLRTHRFITCLTHRPGEVTGFENYAAGVECALDNPTEHKVLHPEVLVYRVYDS